LIYQLGGLVENDHLKKYLQPKDRSTTSRAVKPKGNDHVTLFSGTSIPSPEDSRVKERQPQAKSSIFELWLAFETMELRSVAEPTLYFSTADQAYVHPHGNDLVVITVVTIGCNVHRVLVDQGSSTNMMFFSTFEGLRIPRDQLKPFDGTLVDFNGDQMELWTTFSDGENTNTITIKYIVVNTPSSYNMLLGR